MPDQEPTNTEILKAITEGQKHTDGRIDEILEVVNDFSTKIDKRFDKVEEDVGTLKADVTAIKATLVDKDYLDRALGKTEGNILLTLRKEDLKLRELIALLGTKQILTPAEIRHIMSMEPFPQLSV